MARKLMLGLLALAGFAALAVHLFVPPFLKAGTGISAKQLCSMTFVTGLEPDRAWGLYLEPILQPYATILRYEVDRDKREATASVFGFGWKSRAVYREGLGCTLVHGSAADFDREASLPAMGPPFSPMVRDETARSMFFDTDKLDQAVADAFSTKGSTLAVAVLHRGALVAEGYAEGVGPETPLHGWSMTKSTAATLAGVLTERGLINVTADGAVPALVANGRPDITVNDLLRMQAGLAIDERNDGFDPNSDMLFTESDMAAFASSREKVAEPGATFDYQSGQTVLAGSAMREALGGDPAAQMQTIRDWLFEPIGIRTAVLEPDQAGNFVWSSYMFASARDWARLGQLYLDGGVAPNGQRLLPEGWNDYVTTPTASNSRYGAGFWLFRNTAETGAMTMDGFQGQNTYVLPHHDLVVVRLGADAGWSGLGIAFAQAVVAAKREIDVAEDEPSEE